MIPFNKPCLTGNELTYIADAVHAGNPSGNGKYSRLCHQYFEESYGYPKCLLTTSCTDALEMAALLLDIQPGDEVILPAFTFVSTANAFALRGAKLVFADCEPVFPNIDPAQLSELVTGRTKAIVVVHYAGVACDMDAIMAFAEERGIWVIEDAAQAVDSYYLDRPLGSIGHLATFSFHESKNITCGEGGMLVINDSTFLKRAEILWEKGTDRAAFFRGEVDKYGWVDVGSSFLLSDILAAYLWAQVEQLTAIQKDRLAAWEYYQQQIQPLVEAGHIKGPNVPAYASHNAHIFFILCKSIAERSALIEHLANKGIKALFHYLPLHLSPYYHNKYHGSPLPHCVRYADTLLRIPLFHGITRVEQDAVVQGIKEFYC